MAGRTRKHRPETLSPQELFESIVCDADEWLRVAGSLMRSSEELAKIRADPSQRGSAIDFYSLRPMELCVAFAIENAFKAVMAAAGLVEIGHRGRISFGCDPHDLLALRDELQRAGSPITLSSSEEQTLARLTQAATWAAWYPSPTSASKLAAELIVSNCPVEEVLLGRRILEYCKSTVAALAESRSALLSETPTQAKRG